MYTQRQDLFSPSIIDRQAGDQAENPSLAKRPISSIFSPTQDQFRDGTITNLVFFAKKRPETCHCRFLLDLQQLFHHWRATRYISSQNVIAAQSSCFDLFFLLIHSQRVFTKSKNIYEIANFLNKTSRIVHNV